MSQENKSMFVLRADGTLGVENLKRVILFVINLAEEGFSIAADGKVTIWEMLGLVDNVRDLPAVIKAIGKVREEYLAMTLADKTELISLVQGELQLPNPRIEAIIESAFAVLINLQSIWTLRRL